MRKIDYKLSLLLGSISNMAATADQCIEMAEIQTKSDKDVDRIVKKLQRVGKLLVEMSEPISKRLRGVIEESSDDPNET